MNRSPSSRPTTVDEYLVTLEDPARARIAALRQLVRDELPDVDEAIKWGNPAFIHPSGTILLVVSAHKAHANFTVTPSAKDAFTAELAGLETGKGSVKLPYDAPVPEELLRRIVRHRLAEHEQDGVGWM